MDAFLENLYDYRNDEGDDDQESTFGSDTFVSTCMETHSLFTFLQPRHHHHHHHRCCDHPNNTEKKQQQQQKKPHCAGGGEHSNGNNNGNKALSGVQERESASQVPGRFGGTELSAPCVETFDGKEDEAVLPLCMRMLP